jgi:hypothetical protein
MNHVSTWTAAGFLGVALTAVPAFGQHSHHASGHGGASHGGSRPTPAMHRPSEIRPVANHATPGARPGSTVRPGSTAIVGASARPGSTATARPTLLSATSASSRPRPSTVASSTQTVGNRRPGSRPAVSLGLSDTANTNLIAAKTNVGPLTQKAINDALAGQLLTAADVGYLKGALENNTQLTGPQKAAIASALQADAAAKRRLQNGNGNATVVVNGLGGGGLGGGGQNEYVATGATTSGDAGLVTTGGAIGGGNLQSVRYLAVTNRTGERLTVYAQTADVERPWEWTFEPGEEAVLSIKGNWIAADKAWVWAEAGGKEWTANKEEAVVLAEQPYEADGIETFAYAFDA